MISFLLLCFTLSAKNDNLLETIHIYSGFTAEEIRKHREEKQKEYDQKMAECKQNKYMKDMCETIYASFKPGNMISEEEVDETIKKIDSFTLIIQSYGYYGKIDLSTMKKRAALVTIAQNGPIQSLPSATNINIEGIQKEMKNIKFDVSLSNMLKVHNIIISHTKNEKAYGKQGVLEIVGDIKNKVGYLQVTAGITKIIDSPLNSDSAAFLMGTLTSDSQPINVKYLTVDLDAYKSLKMDNIQVQQFFLTFIFDRYYSNYEYNKIHYTEKSWAVYIGNSLSDLSKLSFSLPYTSAERFGVITNALSFIITRVTDEFDVKGLNITVGQYIPTGANLNTKETISLKLDNNWKESNVKPNVVVVADKNQYHLDQSEAPGLNAKLESHYVEKPSSSNSKKIGIIIGVVVAVVVVIVVIIVVIVILKKKKAAKEGSSNQEGEENAEQA